MLAGVMAGPLHMKFFQPIADETFVAICSSTAARTGRIIEASHCRHMKGFPPRSRYPVLAWAANQGFAIASRISGGLLRTLCLWGLEISVSLMEQNFLMVEFLLQPPHDDVADLVSIAQSNHGHQAADHCKRCNCSKTLCASSRCMIRGDSASF